MSLALSTLIYEWCRYLAAVIALAFSGLLILAQVGMFAGIGRAFTANISRSPAEIMVLAPKAESLMQGSAGVPRRLMPQVYMHPEVVQVRDLAGVGSCVDFCYDGFGRRVPSTELLAVPPPAANGRCAKRCGYGEVTWP